MSENGLRNTLKLGALVFGGSAILLLLLPGQFVKLLGLSQVSQMSWAMRMLGITVFALAGNMFQHARMSSRESLKVVAWVMFLSAGVLGVLTLLIPVHKTAFTLLYAGIGFAFSAAYLTYLVSARK